MSSSVTITSKSPLLAPDKQNRRWSTKEIGLLQKHINTHGAKKWELAAGTLEGRTPKAVSSFYSSHKDRFKRGVESNEAALMQAKIQELEAKCSLLTQENAQLQHENTQYLNDRSIALRGLVSAAKGFVEYQREIEDRHRQEMTEKDKELEALRGQLEEERVFKLCTNLSD